MSKHYWNKLLEQLWPLNRVHSGPEMVTAWRRLAQAYSGCKILSWPPGYSVSHWKVPPAWKLNRGRLIDPKGNIIADSEQHKLHVFAFSPSFKGKVSREELEKHLFTIPDKPRRIPFHFRNQYRFWDTTWGFCIPYDVYKDLSDGEYFVEIDSEFDDSQPMEGVLQTYKGEYTDSILFVGHFDHPFQACDGLLGCLAGHEIIERLKGRKTKLTYRMLSSVEVVGSVFYAVEQAHKDGVKEAMVTATAGAEAPLIYAGSSSGKSFIDRAISHVLQHAKEKAETVPFRSTLGNDEAAFDVSGVDIPCGSLMRWPFPEYHTDADTPEIVNKDLFEEYVRIVSSMIDIAEYNSVMVPRFKGLPCLASPDLDLYISPTRISGVSVDQDSNAQKLMNKLPDEYSRIQAKNYASSFNNMMKLLPALINGTNTVLDVAEKCELPFAIVNAYTDMWQEAGLIEKQWINPFQGRVSTS